MSDKELMYIDDTLGHLEQFNEYSKYLCNIISDEIICDLIKKIRKTNKKTFDSFYNLVK